LLASGTLKAGLLLTFAMSCELLGGAHGVIAQLALASVALISLVLKRYTERPRRPVQIWGFDVSKQAFAAGAAHGCGMLWAILMARYTSQRASECAWYFVVFTVDTSCGMAVALYLHALVLRVVQAHYAQASSGVELGEVDARLKQAPAFSVRLWTGAVAMCGQYGDPPSLRIFLPQMAEFVACVVAGRLVCGAAVFLGAVPLGFAARGVDALFVAAAPAGREEDVAEAELWTVMVLGPLTMNVVQVLVQDAFLKFRGSRHSQQQSLLEPFAPNTGSRRDFEEP